MMSLSCLRDASPRSGVCFVWRSLIMRGLYCKGMGLLLSGCSRVSKQVLSIGPHCGSFRLPSDWAVVNQGEKWGRRKGEAFIVLHDLGSVSPASLQ